MGKKSFLIALLISMLFSFTVYSQQNNQTNNQTNNNDERQYQLIDESTIVFTDSANSDSQQSEQSLTTGSTVWLFVRMIIFLLLVVAAIYGILWVFKKKTNITKDEDDFLRRVAYLNLGPDKTVEVVTLIDRAFLIGVTDGGINLISEIEDKELIEAMNLNADKKAVRKKPLNFAEVLDMFTATATGKNTTVYGDTGNQLTDKLKKRRNSFNKTE